jgi:hypothetical protein
MKYSLRQCTDADECFLRNPQKRCYKEVVVAQFGNWDAEVQRRFFDKKWRPSKYEIIAVEGRDVGCLSRSKKHGHLILSEIQIDPDLLESGIGVTCYERLCGIGAICGTHGSATSSAYESGQTIL